ncbi:MAG: alpha/beta hydrolase-fold protein [Bacillota bacterium]|nr:alpha/beta hydrolase-fold protein [Bacillota bacterium]
MIKKLSCLLALLILISSLSACSNQKQETQTTKAVPKVITTPISSTSGTSTGDSKTDANNKSPDLNGSQLLTKQIPAPSLMNNIIGEPTNQEIDIYLPASYFTENKYYPVFYFLPGFGDTSSYYGTVFKDEMDNLLKNSKVKDMIIVSVNGQNKLTGSFYVNSPVTGNWEDFVVKDVVSYVDSNYRTIKKSSARGISGHSMGGFGTINIAMRHPEVFSCAYALSPGLFDKSGLSESDIIINESYLDMIKASESSGEFIGDFTNAYGAAFSPNANGKIPYINYPYKLIKNKLIKDTTVLKAWENGFGGLEGKVIKYKSNLKKLHALTIEYGTNDEYTWIPKGCEYFSSLLKSQKIKHTLVSFDGDHQGHVVERIREQVLPFFSNNLSFN